MPSIWHRVWNRADVGADGWPRTCNYRGDRIDAGGMVYLPLCLIHAINLKLLGRRPEIPWLGYRAIRRIGTLITAEYRVLEFGSGMSSLWFARRCRDLVSIETNQEWHSRVKNMLQTRRVANVDYRLRPVSECEVVADPDQSFDFALVDGHRRDACVITAVNKVRPGGFIYLDNTDVNDDEHNAAKQTLLAAADQVETYNDFYPGFVGVNEGMLVRLRTTPSHPPDSRPP